jgi:hypothetical protein
MAINTSESEHPVTSAVSAMRTLLAGLADASLFAMSPAEAAQTLTELAALAAMVAEMNLRVAAHADVVQVGLDAGASSTATWWAHETGQDRGDAARRLRLAHALGDGRAKVRAAFAAGDISEEAASIIVRALDALPDDLDPLTVRRAEAVMVQHARDLGPRQLRLAGKALLAVVAPAVADAHEERLLDAEERRAQERMRFSMSDDGHGTTRGSFVLPTLYAMMLRKMLMALAAPKHQRAQARRRAGDDADPAHAGQAFETAESAEAVDSIEAADTGKALESADSTEAPDATDTLDVTQTADQAVGASQDAAEADAPTGHSAAEEPEEELPPWRQPTPHRLGQALAELIERFAGGDLPEAGGMAATIVVTMTLDQLQGGPGAAQLDTGDRVTAGQARRLACQAGIIPLVLGGKSVPLDVGRRRRFHDRYQRLVIQRRDQTCTVHGCDVPGWLCHFHHDPPWGQGGGTSVEHGRMLCPRHHHQVHDPSYQTTHRADGRVELHRCTVP